MRRGVKHATVFRRGAEFNMTLSGDVKQNWHMVRKNSITNVRVEKETRYRSPPDSHRETSRKSLKLYQHAATVSAFTPRKWSEGAPGVGTSQLAWPHHSWRWLIDWISWSSETRLVLN